MSVDPENKPGLKGRLKGSAARFGEILLTLLLVLLCFAGFFSLLNSFFPTGTSLRQLVTSREPTPGGEATGGRQIRTEGGEPGGEALAAVLSEARNEVKSKPASSIAWGAARAGMKLYNRDAVQTFEGSEARITFDADNYLRMGSHSLVIIKRLEKDPWLNQRRSFMVMVEGELSGRIAAAGEGAMQVEVATPEAVARILPDSSGQEADFKISVLPDQSSSIVVYQGSAEISAQGKRVRVEANQGLTLRPGEEPAAPAALPDPPQLSQPADGTVTSFRDLPPRTLFSWSPQTAGDQYRFTLARDAEFENILVDVLVDKPEFVHGSLKPGTYHWRVSSLRDGCEGLPGAPRTLQLAQDREPPRLQVDYPQAPVAPERFTLRGSAEAGSRVFVDGRETAVDAQGRFASEITLGAGLNSILVEAVDSAGNIAYQGGIVQRKL